MLNPLRKTRNVLACISLASFALSCTALWFFFITLEEEPSHDKLAHAHDVSGWLATAILGIFVLSLMATVITTVLTIAKERKVSRR